MSSSNMYLVFASRPLTRNLIWGNICLQTIFRIFFFRITHTRYKKISRTHTSCTIYYILYVVLRIIADIYACNPHIFIRLGVLWMCIHDEYIVQFRQTILYLPIYMHLPRKPIRAAYIYNIHTQCTSSETNTSGSTICIHVCTLACII